ncbi:CRISPR-associated protein Cas3 [[Pantoea] beijingensis]|uniref:CRISPR-associated protein Cas3 n=1 Tax=[Pantoea] beijingensis TaxID=1324864 RepID=A0A443I8T5_9GAMM|nr:type I-F CRISPR-associated helicase Cas3f [[Pantoea] beijingensis]RWR00504.1 CRISPR-associated protein Cas3 [[Pantoea] beijingensis]
MHILVISQCSKRARDETRRILDQFAERKGDNTWQTAITLEGVNTLRRLLRKTARRNTAVACHWIKSAGQTELLWIVGNLRRFNLQGSVPTNQTGRDILRSQDETPWRSAESIALLAGIAGLFHDFGKASALFQLTLKGDAEKRFQPWRHEWISLRLFQAFIGEQDDRQWLTRLNTITPEYEHEMLARLVSDESAESQNPFYGLPPVATVIGWLILSHHRLPTYLGTSAPPEMQYAQNWLINQLRADWNALNREQDWSRQELQRAQTFPNGTPLQSETWRNKAHQLGKRALNSIGSLQEHGELGCLFTVHMARLVLMLADHSYSAAEPVKGWQAPNWPVWANTNRTTGQLKQQLDEHNIGVGQGALLLGRTLPQLRQTLPAITRHKGFRQRVTDKQFAWQDRAFDQVYALRERARQQGFFGINMASTGCGKTFANARMMYALADEQEGCRFSVALGLRTLTLQTGDALRARLNLDEDALAVLIGSSAVSDLHRRGAQPESDCDSASAERLFEPHQYVHYEGSLDDGPLRRWMANDPKLHQLISAPVLVCTIDHLMPATEGVRGGKQIAPMLRLLSSDLVLDEPDEFSVDDQYALCRLVNWAGMCGSRVLLSSATLSPALVQALFTAYLCGRKAYQRACGEPDAPLNICCGWFDEQETQVTDIAKASLFAAQHARFVGQRIAHLQKKKPLRLARVLAITPPVPQVKEVIARVADTLHPAMLQLHQKHHQAYPGGKTVSFGIVRFANINPLVAVAEALLASASSADMRIHYCVYHSQHPLAMRSAIEERLDTAFNRQHLPLDAIADVHHALKGSTETHHLFVVLATSIAELGRDWDADWAIAEPSSMRALVQLAGRIQRHRQHPPSEENLLIMNRNIRSLRHPGCDRPVFCRPGFESTAFRLTHHAINEVLDEDQYRAINAVPCITGEAPSDRQRRDFSNLVTLEQHRLWEALLGRGALLSAADWWRNPITWSGELQRRTPFRQSQPEDQYFLHIDDEFSEPEFYQRDSGPTGWKKAGAFREHDVALAEGVSVWAMPGYQAVYHQLAEEKALELKAVSEKYGEINLRLSVSEKGEAWYFHPWLGVFRPLW